MTHRKFSINKLTKKQTNIYAFLQSRDTNLPALNLSTLCVALGVQSRISLQRNIQTLIHAGLIGTISNRQCKIYLTNNIPPNSNALPFKGNIEAGKPLQVFKKTSRIPVPTHLKTQKDCSVFTFKGNSMIEAGLIDGDLLIIEKTQYAKNDEIVLALIDNNEATLKRYENAGAITILHPENGAMKPYVFEASRVKIIGKLVGQMRRYSSS